MTEFPKKTSLKDEIKSRLSAEIDEKTLKSFAPATVSPENVRQHRFGQSLLAIAVLAAIAGVYLPPTDPAGRAMFLCFALILAIMGASRIDRANRELTRGRHKGRISALPAQGAHANASQSLPKHR